MKKTTVLFLYQLFNSLLFSEQDVSGYIGIPVSEKISIYDSPWFFNTKAIRYKLPEMLKLLIEKGYDINEPFIGSSNGDDSSESSNILKSALNKREIDIVKILLESGVYGNFIN